MIFLILVHALFIAIIFWGGYLFGHDMGFGKGLREGYEKAWEDVFAIFQKWERTRKSDEA